MTIVYLVLTASGACALEPGRQYEMVTPLFKGGYGGVLIAAAPDGEGVAFSSPGSFAKLPLAGTGNAYVTYRAVGEAWLTHALQPPFYGSGIEDFSSTFGLALSVVPLEDGQLAVFVHDPRTPDTVEDWMPIDDITVNAGAHYAGASGDLCHVVISGTHLLPGAPTGAPELYDISRGCDNSSPSLQMLSGRNVLTPEGATVPVSASCTVGLGGFGGEQTLFNAISGDGGEVFFNAYVEQGPNVDCSSGVRQLFVRMGGKRTVEVSRPLDTELPFGGCGDGGAPGETPGEVPCPGAATRPSAVFRGASEDGSVVFFTTNASLVAGDSDGASDLYMAHIGCREGVPSCEAGEREVTSLERVSAGQTPGTVADVFGVVNVARDGSAVYFMAHGALTSIANAEGEVAASGADNLYGYDVRDGALKFVARLCSGSAVSGEVGDSHCPTELNSERNDTNLWGTGGEAQVSDDGRYLVFVSLARLVGRGPGVDADANADVYRFDLLTGDLQRVSVGEAGYGGNGNGPADATIGPGDYGGTVSAKVATEHEMDSRAVSNDGAWVVFMSRELLSPRVSNGNANVYLWHAGSGSSNGEVSLLSSGSSLTDDLAPVIASATSPEARDVMFMTTAGLAPADTENDLDVYDARLGGGFPAATTGKAQCSSDVCQGGLTSPAPLLVPGSVSQLAGQNWPPPPKKKAVRKAKRKRPKGKRSRRSTARSRASAKAKRSARRGARVAVNTKGGVL